MGPDEAVFVGLGKVFEIGGKSFLGQCGLAALP